MNTKVEDPRVRKTRRSLREALIRLILRMGYDSITIQDISYEAETARITFYRHYRDKEELLTDCLNTLYNELVLKVSREMEQAPAGDTTFTSLHVRVFYEHLEEQEKLYRVLFSSVGQQTVMNNLKMFMAQQLIDGMRRFPNRERPAIPDEIIAHHLISANVGLGIWWLENNKPYPIDYMIDISAWLSFAGAQHALGLEDVQPPLPQPA